MDFVNFWKLVEKHPWLPRILLDWDSLEEQLSKGNPNSLDFLGITALRNEIRYIAFRPWNTLADSEVLGEKMFHVIERGVGAKVPATTHAECYYHIGEERPFKREVFSGFKGAGQSVQELVEVIEKQQGHLDAVVLRTWIDGCAIPGGTRRNPIWIHISDAYDIFLPPKTS